MFKWLTLAMLIICCSESLWMMAFFTTVDRMNGYWQNVNLTGWRDRGLERLGQSAQMLCGDSLDLTQKYQLALTEKNVES